MLLNKFRNVSVQLVYSLLAPDQFALIVFIDALNECVPFVVEFVVVRLISLLLEVNLPLQLLVLLEQVFNFFLALSPSHDLHLQLKVSFKIIFIRHSFAPLKHHIF